MEDLQCDLNEMGMLSAVLGWDGFGVGDDSGRGFAAPGRCLKLGRIWEGNSINWGGF